MSTVNETLIRDVVAEVLGNWAGPPPPWPNQPPRRPPPRRPPPRRNPRPRSPTVRQSLRRAGFARQVRRVSTTPTKPAPRRRKRFCNSSRRAWRPAARSRKSSRRWRKRTPRPGAKLNMTRPKSAGWTTKSPSCKIIQAGARRGLAAAGRAQRRPRHHAGGIHAVRRRRRGHAQHAFDSHAERQHRQHRARPAMPWSSTRTRPRPAAPRWPCAPTTRPFTVRLALKTSLHHREADAGLLQRPLQKRITCGCCWSPAGPCVVKAAMQTGKRAICAGPGNPPVFVDDTCCMTRAAKAIIEGAAYDNNLLCIGEKEVFVLDRSRTS